MKNTQIITATIIFVLIINPMTPNIFIQAQAQTEGNFQLNLVTWTGTRNPGSTVQVEFQLTNLHNNTLTSIIGVLKLQYPFTDATDGDSNATSIGESLIVYFNVSQYLVLEGDLFQLIYSLDIAENASKGFYAAELELNYFIKSGLGVSPGTPAIFLIELEIPNAPPEIDWLRPTAGTIVVEPGNEINFTIICSDRDNDSLEYSWEVEGIPVNITEPTFLFTSQETVGIQEIIVSISDKKNTILRTWLVETNIPSKTYLDVSSQYIKAGVTSTLVANITNNLWKGKVEIDLQIPSPLIIQSNSSFSFLNITERESLSIPISIFTPQTAMGSTLSVLFSIQFSDKHDTNYAETISTGLIIHGWIQVSVFSSDISVTSVRPGESIVVSATLLNTGNAYALFTNASLESNDNIFVDTTSRKNYIGELEPDSPLPFSLTGFINSSTSSGDYQIRCDVYYQDGLFNVHKIMIDFTITVKSYSPLTSTKTGVDLNSLLIGSGIILLLGGGTIIAMVFVVFRRRSVK